MKRIGRVDPMLAALIAILLVAGTLLFASAAFGLLARGATNVTSVVFNHMVLGVGLGLLGLFITSRIDYKLWRRFAPHLFVLALIGTALVFIPHLGVAHGGGKRWIEIANISIQPSEALKTAAIFMAAAYFATVRAKIRSIRWGLAGFCAIIAPVTVILVAQPDLGTLGVITLSVGAVYIAAGARLRDLFVLAGLALIALVILTSVRPYVRDRVAVFFNPSHAPQAEGYQIRQSLIAIGSGGILGRGLGQGVQKFTYLPEPMGDSIFAVAGEEFGFAGAVTLIALYLIFALRGFAVASHSPDLFGGLLAVGISAYLVSEAFINMAAMLGVAPLTGIPLTFMSQGGTAMLFSLSSAGILLNISRHGPRR